MARVGRAAEGQTEGGLIAVDHTDRGEPDARQTFEPSLPAARAAAAAAAGAASAGAAAAATTLRAETFVQSARRGNVRRASSAVTFHAKRKSLALAIAF